MKENLQLLALGLAIMATLVLLFGGLIWMTRDLDFKRDAQCRRLYGQDYHYTNRRATDCVNNQGEGKFLP